MELPVRIYKRPRLRNPYLIVGWADAGHVGIDAIDYLIEQLGAEEFGEIEPPSRAGGGQSQQKGLRD